MNRSDYIGSSDARDILSGDWDRMYRRKKGLIPEDDLSNKFHVQLGVITEPFHLDWTIAALNEERGGGFRWSKAQPNGEQHFSAFNPAGTDAGLIIGSHPDALLKDEAGAIYPLEAKMTGRFRTAEEAADFYMPQIQHHMLAWGTTMMLLSVSINNLEPERLWIGASSEWQDHYIERCVAFWHHISSGIPPAPFFGTAEIKVPQKAKDSVPINGFKKRSLEGNNRAEALIPDFLETKRIAARHEDLKKELKDMMAPDENELYHPAIVLKRDARGAIRFTIKDETYGAAVAAE